jgi:Tfp pilus assembly protein PilZ
MIKTAVSPAPLAPRKVFARVALIHVDEAAAAVLRECFRQFGIHTVRVEGDAEHRLRREKFEACVVCLSDPHAESVVNAARTSPSNSRIVIYGISSSAQEALRFSRYGLNAMLDAPVERQTALKLVRATHLLVLHEFRRYVRVPVIMQVEVVSGNGKFRASSKEISAGGMSVKTTQKLRKEQAVEVTFTLPNMRNVISVRASVCWIRDAEHLVGVRFDLGDDERLHVKRWIDNYLDIA